MREKVSTWRCLPPVKRRYDEAGNLEIRMNRDQHERYSRQILFRAVGEAGQERILASRAVLVGCGALGGAVANLLARAGIGWLRIIDRDFVEPSNLQRQTLFTEADARESLPKAIAAERNLRAINSDVRIEPVVGDLTSGNARELLSGFPLILDGTDNFETRWLVNDAAVASGTPWIYAAAVGSYGLTLTIRAGQTACLACLVQSDTGGAPAGAEETCDTAGVLGSVVGVIAAIEAGEAIKLLSGNTESLNDRLISCDTWSGRFQSVRVLRNPDCRACARREFTYLEGQAQPHITLCGRDSVQIHERRRKLDLAELGRRLAAASGGGVRNNEFLLRFRVPPYELTVFADGRAIVKGTQDPAVARSLYARYIG